MTKYYYSREFVDGPEVGTLQEVAEWVLTMDRATFAIIEDDTGFVLKTGENGREPTSYTYGDQGQMIASVKLDRVEAEREIFEMVINAAMKWDSLISIETEHQRRDFLIDQLNCQEVAADHPIRTATVEEMLDFLVARDQ